MNCFLLLVRGTCGKKPYITSPSHGEPLGDATSSVMCIIYTLTFNTCTKKIYFREISAPKNQKKIRKYL